MQEANCAERNKQSPQRALGQIKAPHSLFDLKC